MHQAPVEPWRDEIVAAYHARGELDRGRYETVTVTFDGEYLRYLDQALDEMCVADGRLPHPGATVRSLVRSVAVEVVMGAFVARRTMEGIDRGVEPADSLTGDLENILLGGLIERLPAGGRSRFVSVELAFVPSSARKLDAELRRIAVEHMAPVDRASYLAGEYADLRSAFVEAGVLTWLLWMGLVADEAVPARETYAMLGQGNGGRRWTSWLGRRGQMPFGPAPLPRLPWRGERRGRRR